MYFVRYAFPNKASKHEQRTSHSALCRMRTTGVDRGGKSPREGSTQGVEGRVGSIEGRIVQPPILIIYTTCRWGDELRNSQLLAMPIPAIWQCHPSHPAPHRICLVETTWTATGWSLGSLHVWSLIHAHAHAHADSRIVIPLNCPVRPLHGGRI